MFKTINDLIAAETVSDDMQIEIDLNGEQSLKITVGQLKEQMSQGLSLEGLSDVELTDPIDLDVLRYNSETGKWVNVQGGGGSASSLGELEDVTLTEPVAGQYLAYDDQGEVWVNAPLPESATSLVALSDVEIMSPVDYEFLAYNANQDLWVNTSLPFIPDELEDLDNVSIMSPVQDHVLGYNEQSSQWENKALSDVAFTSMIYVASNGNDTTGNGSLSKPYKTIQKAVDMVSNPCIIMVGFGTYTGNIVIHNKTNLQIQGAGFGIDAQTTEIKGSITISGTSIRTKLINLNIDCSVSGAPGVYDNGSKGRLGLSNVSIIHSDPMTPGLRIEGGEGFINADLCNIDKVELIGTPSSLRTITFTNCVVGPTTISSPFYACQGIRCSVFGPVVHQAGVLYLNFVSLVPKIATDGITSTCNAGLGQLLIDNCNFQQADLSYARINKTGTCPYGIGSSNRNTATDVLNGVRGLFKDTSNDSFIGFTPVNYTPANGSLKAHLEAIDAKLGTL